ncbi:MAG: ADP-forming succinate--CoA ligase subunit beta [Dongiaceae bacterium]
MNVHEYQAKSLLRRYGVAVPRGGVAYTALEAETVARELGGPVWVVKAQIHAGGRGKAEGVKVVHSLDEAKAAAAAMLGRRLVTAQTGPGGRQVGRVYIEEGCAVARELYVAVLVDRNLGRVAILTSAAGGMEVEAAAGHAPGTVAKRPVDPATGLLPAEAAGLAAGLGLAGAAAAAAASCFARLYDAFVGLDASLIEINPLGVTREGGVIALDARMSFDDNALFRHRELEELRDPDERDATELEAARHEINYVAMDGDIGCMVNGAGLAMATLDVVDLYGGAPANFMDVRPVATREQIAAGVRMMLSNANLKAILVNIFGGGILRCDLVAEAMVAAAREVGLRVPLVVRFAGTNDDIGKKLMRNSGLAVTFATDMADAAEKAAALAKTAGTEASPPRRRWPSLLRRS